MQCFITRHFSPGNIEKLGECMNCYRKQKCIMASGEWMYKNSAHFCAHLESKMKRQWQMGFCFSTPRWQVSELSIKNHSFYDSSLILQVYHLIYSTASKRPKKDKHLAWWQRKGMIYGIYLMLINLQMNQFKILN